MNQENKLIMSLPIKPQKHINIGGSIGPVVGEYLSKTLDCEFVTSINTLHSFQDVDNYLNQYTQALENDLQIENKEFLIDSDHINKLLENINKLYENKYIVEVKKEILTCKCGMVEISKESVDEVNGKLFVKEKNKYVCRNCNEECLQQKHNALVIPYNYSIDYSVRVIPSFLTKDMEQLAKKYKGKDLIISKIRKTGITFETTAHTYNIDVEYVWSQLFSLYEHEEKYLIASNHQLYVAYVMNFLAEMSGHRKLTFVLTPYMKTESYFKELNTIFNTRGINSKTLKLYIILSLKWKKKECSWDHNLFKALKKMDSNKIDDLITKTQKKVSTRSTNNNDILEKTLQISTNYQLIKK